MKTFPLQIALLAALLVNDAPTWSQSKTYFPRPDAKWETVKAKKAGLNPEGIQDALDLSFRNQSTSVVILYRGRIVAERHLLNDDPKLKEIRLGRMRIGANSAGYSIEDVASVQKSVTSLLVGLTVNKQLLQLDDPVSKYLGAGWSKATPSQEARILVRHLITMSSGLNRKLEYVAKPGTRWAYNTSVYALVMQVVEKAGGSDRNTLTKNWLLKPIHMADSKWINRPNAIRTTSGNTFGFATTARDLAKLGWLILNDGKWDRETVYKHTDYFKQMTRSSQSMNPAYGYLWWLNGKEFSLRPAGIRSKGWLIPTAPADMFDASGALGRKLYIVPSKQLVVVRLGAQPQLSYPRQFWKTLLK